MTENRKPCRRCLLEDASRQDVKEQIGRLIELMPKEEKASRETYEKRIGICRLCDELIDGTCSKCGCFVELRAMVKNERCPHEKQLW